MQSSDFPEGAASVFDLLVRLNAWSPALPSLEDWNRWAEGGQDADPFPERFDAPSAPSVNFLPVALRKKLSTVCKVALHLMHETLSEEERRAIRIVMSSRNGEAHTTLELLEAIAKDEPSSPMAFSRSVHNASVGLFSIAMSNTNSNVALAAMEYSFGMGLIEAVTQLYAQEDPRILYVYADEQVPLPFQEFTNDPPQPFGIALLLERKELDGELYDILEGIAEMKALDFLQFSLIAL